MFFSAACPLHVSITKKRYFLFYCMELWFAVTTSQKNLCCGKAHIVTPYTFRYLQETNLFIQITRNTCQ
jgi:hypothetical protein